MKISQEILEIFFDTPFRVSNFSIVPKNMTQKYKKELEIVYFDEIFVATEYKNIENPLKQYKFYSDISQTNYFLDIFDVLFDELYKTRENVEKFKKECIIVSVPMHWTRYFSRGFDHIKRIAVGISKRQLIPYKKLLSAKYTQRQSHLSREKRLKNKENAYTILKQKNFPKIVILLDDVISSATTVNSCAKMLKNAWVETVIVCVLATNFH